MIKCQMSPSARGLQCLILLCEQYAKECDIIFNVKKSVYTCINPKHFVYTCINPQHCVAHNVPFIYLNVKCIDPVTEYNT